MSKSFRRLLVSIVSILLIVCILAGFFGIWTVRRSFPKTDGQTQISGLDAPVDIYRDSYGIPHIYATTTHDLFFAQGYVHAQDRFWQMDFWRHIGSGRLAEMFGDSQIETDRFIRTLGWNRLAQDEANNLDPQSRLILEAYSAGVNTYLAQRQGSALSLEYAILKMLNPEYTPEPWQPSHSLTWAKAMAWDLGGNMDAEIEMALMMSELTPEQISQVAPSYPQDHPYILPGFSGGRTVPATNAQAAQQVPHQLSTLLGVLSQKAASLDALTGPRGSGIGSNNWVIAGERTATGQPLLVNDPHLSAQMPSIWYEVGLHCIAKGPDCSIEATGFSFAGTPGIVIGHNDRIAWGFTNVGPDVQDLYIEKINPNNPNQYEVNGRWVDMELVNETIAVAGGQPVEITVRYTRHGPLVSDTYERAFMEELGDSPALEFPPLYAIALHWTALEGGETFPAIWRINQAQNWEEFRAGTAEFDVPSQNMIYADVDGNIGYQTPGLIPLRASGDGSLPVPGWTDDYEWTGFIPFEELPFAFNPPEGYIATANNPVVGPQYPYLIGTQFDYGFRARRIVELIEQAPGPIDSAYIQTMQGDNKNLLAEDLVPLLLALPQDSEDAGTARTLFEGWDYQDHMDSAPAALFAVFTKNLLAETFHDDLPEMLWPTGGARWWEVLRQLVKQPDSQWWDDLRTPETENRDAIFARALALSVEESKKLLGNSPQKWSWGDLHTITWVNASLGESGIAPIEALFNRGPYRTSGGDSIVNATGWNARSPYTVDWVPSMRMIVDLSSLANSLSIHTTGQSGHAFHPNYIDMTDKWRLIEYHPMLWETSQVQNSAAAHLQLLP
jgi:penicillin amidase